MPINVFFCYSHEDEPFLKQLKSHLMPLQQQNLIEMWHDRDINAGTEWKQEISNHLNAAHMILLLISSDFMDSEYCYEQELQWTLARHERGEVHVVPIILRPVFWQEGPLGKLQALPTDGKPLMSANWSNIDEALLNVVEGIYKIIRKQFPELYRPERPSQQRNNEANTGLSPSQQIHMSPSMTSTSEDFSLIHTLVGHALYVADVSSNSDDQIFASAGGDGIKLWNLLSGKLVRIFKHQANGASSVNISPNGQVIISGGRDGVIKLWNMHSGKLLNSIEQPENSTYCISTSSDSRTFVSGGSDGVLRLRNLYSGKLIRTFEHQANDISSVVISPDGQFIISGGSDGVIKLWNLHSGKLLRNPKGHANHIHSIAVSSSGQMFASCGDDEMIKLWDLQSGRLQRVIRQDADSIYSIAIEPGGYILAGSMLEGMIKLWNMHTGELVQILEGQARVLSIAISPNGKFIISGNEDGTIQVWKRTVSR